jgi:predicted nucleic acid-binding Zn ribbon protein
MEDYNQNTNQTPNMPQQPEMNKNMKACKSCGAPISKKAKTCPNCGAKNKNHKILVVILILLALIIIIAVAGSGGDDSTDTATKTQTNGTVETVESDENSIGQYSVEITKARLTSTYDGKPAVVVTYKFTNNSDDTPESFNVAFDDEVYQNGVGLNSSYFLKEGDPYSSDNASKEIKIGASIEVEKAYELNDSSTPIEVEVKELFSFNDETITRTFDLK